MMNVKRANQNNSKTIYTFNFDFPKIVTIIAIIILVLNFLPCFISLEFGAISFMSALFTLAVILTPFHYRTKIGFVQITDTAVIINDWFYCKIQKSYRLDTITNVAVYSFYGINTLILEIAQGFTLTTKKIKILLIKDAETVYNTLSNLISCVKNDNDVLVELAQENNEKLEQIAQSIKNNNNQTNN